MKTDAGVERFLERMGAFLTHKGLKHTKQRDVIAAAVFRSTGHLTVEEIYELVREEDPKVGYTTIYRTLRLLRESGLVHERHFGEGGARFEVVHDGEHHDHLICNHCGTIVEFEDPAIEARQEHVAKSYGFVVESHKHEIYGRCGKCSGMNA